MNLYKIFRNFQNGRHFEFRASFLTRSPSENWVQRLNNQSNSLHFELLIDVLAQILSELRQFQNLTYFCTSWPSYLTFDLVHLQDDVRTRLHIWTKFSDDWQKTATCISENVTISFKHEHRRPTLTSRCDVISDLINIKNTLFGTISDDLSISDVKMNLSKIFRKFQNGHHFEVRASFYTGSCIGICIIQQDRPCYSLHFELLIDDVAQIFTKLLQFQNLTYFLAS